VLQESSVPLLRRAELTDDVAERNWLRELSFNNDEDQPPLYPQCGETLQGLYVQVQRRGFAGIHLAMIEAAVTELKRKQVIASALVELVEQGELQEVFTISTPGPQRSTGAGEGTPARHQRAVSREKYQILTALKGLKMLASVPDLVAATGLSETAVKTHRAELLTEGLIETPEGARKGVSITSDGMAIIAAD